MKSEYWMVAHDKPSGRIYRDPGGSWTADRRLADRFVDPEIAHSERRDASTPHCPAVVLHVRIRPRSERLWLAERLKAWEATVKAADWYARVYQTAAVIGAVESLLSAVRAIPEEHRP